MFRGKAKQAKLIRKNSVKFRQIGSIYDILEMSMFDRKIYVLFFFSSMLSLFDCSECA